MTICGNQENPHEFTYKKEIVSEINDIEEVPEGIFPVNLKLINQYQCKYPILMAKYHICKYNTCSSCGGINIDLNLITCRDDI